MNCGTLIKCRIHSSISGKENLCSAFLASLHTHQSHYWITTQKAANFTLKSDPVTSVKQLQVKGQKNQEFEMLAVFFPPMIDLH